MRLPGEEAQVDRHRECEGRKGTRERQGDKDHGQPCGGDAEVDDRSTTAPREHDQPPDMCRSGERRGGAKKHLEADDSEADGQHAFEASRERGTEGGIEGWWVRSVIPVPAHICAIDTGSLILNDPTAQRGCLAPAHAEAGNSRSAPASGLGGCRLGQTVGVSDLSNAVEAVLHAAAGRLQVSGIASVARTPETVTTLLAAGEDVVAYETLCENLYESELVVEQELLFSLRATAQRAGADVDLVEILLS